MSIIIDPPVSPYSSIQELEAWLRRLEELREEHREDPDALAIIQTNEDLTKDWLRDARAQA